MIWCLHGFLGEGLDWEPLRDAIRREASLESDAPSLFSGKDEVAPIETWARQFTEKIAGGDPDPILIGYSMGGRLALHALLESPARFRAAIIISAGLGIEDSETRVARQAQDERWALRFESDEPWPEVISNWNALPVFGGRPSPFVRIEDHFDRRALAEGMRLWSPARHQFLLPRLASVDVSLLWLAGEDDPKYVAEGRRAVANLPQARLEVIPGAGHRVPWENFPAASKSIVAFLESI